MKKTIIISAVSILIVSAAVLAVSRNNERRIIPELGTMLEPVKTLKPLPILEKPFLLVKKKERKLYVYDAEKLVKTYRIGLGFAPVGDKERQGDGKTPEGDFYIFTKNPKSSYYLSLGVSYPSVEDAKRGFEEKLITKAQQNAIISAINKRQAPLQKTQLGGEIYIHGNGSSTDWTLGCVALENSDMKELFDAIPKGTNVRIEP